jgi:hypothetical protein
MEHEVHESVRTPPRRRRFRPVLRALLLSHGKPSITFPVRLDEARTSAKSTARADGD